MRKILFLSGIVCALLSVCCSGKNDKETIPEVIEKKSRFIGNYNKSFNDLNELHMVSAISNGISPMQTRDDTLMLEKELVRIPDALETYTTYNLTHSVPFLVPSATQLLMDISLNFRDSLYSKNMPIYRIFVTSVTRTDDDIAKLTKRNINSIENSAHRYGTTFDISWKRFEKRDNPHSEDINPERLKYVLGQTLFDLQQQQRCYIKHERKQACFHITVR